jgi:hypothetical protein
MHTAVQLHPTIASNASESATSNSTVQELALPIGDDLEDALRELESISVDVLGIRDECVSEDGCLSCS